MCYYHYIIYYYYYYIVICLCYRETFTQVVLSLARSVAELNAFVQTWRGIYSRIFPDQLTCSIAAKPKGHKVLAWRSGMVMVAVQIGIRIVEQYATRGRRGCLCGKGMRGSTLVVLAGTVSLTYPAPIGQRTPMPFADWCADAAWPAVAGTDPVAVAADAAPAEMDSLPMLLQLQRSRAAIAAPAECPRTRRARLLARCLRTWRQLSGNDGGNWDPAARLQLSRCCCSTRKGWLVQGQGQRLRLELMARWTAAECGQGAWWACSANPARS